MANPGMVFSYSVFAIGWLSLGLSAMTDGRTLQGVIGLGLAGASAALAISTARKRQDGRVQVSLPLRPSDGSRRYRP